MESASDVTLDVATITSNDVKWYKKLPDTSLGPIVPLSRSDFWESKDLVAPVDQSVHDKDIVGLFDSISETKELMAFQIEKLLEETCYVGLEFRAGCCPSA
jgi:ACT domain-containing protein